MQTPEIEIFSGKGTKSLNMHLSVKDLEDHFYLYCEVNEKLVKEKLF